MHEFARFVQEQMDAHRYSPADLARRSGLSRSHVSKIINDQRPVLGSMPEVETVAALAKAFSVPDGDVLDAAARAAGLRVRTAPPLLNVTAVSDTALISEINRRLSQAGPIIPPLDLNTLPDSGIAKADDLMRKLRAEAKESAAGGSSGLAELQAHLADYIEQLAKLALDATERKSHPDHAHASDQKGHA